MKKNLTLIAILLAIFSNAQIINFTDPNFKTNLLSITSSPGPNVAKDLNGNTIKLDANNNGEIEISEAQNVSFLNIYGQTYPTKISDANELKYFTNLTYLRFTYHNITTIDLSQLTKLTDVFLHNNQLSSINTVGALALTQINCSYNNLQSLNVSSNINLQSLICEFNQLSNLTIGNLSNLWAVYLKNNNLTNLDFRKTNLRNLHCDNNQLVTLNIQNNFNMSSSASAFTATNNPNLTAVCADTNEVTWLKAYFQNQGNSTVNVSVCNLSTNEVNESNLIYIENPLNNYFHYSSKENVKKVELYTIDGKLINSNLKINSLVSKLASGIYFAKIYFQTGKTLTKKMIKN